VANDTPSTSYQLDSENPWPGLAWFDESAASFFNGRRREIAELKRLVTDAPLTVLFGRSGLGKTSLLKAGLFPSLRPANFLPVYVRFDFTTPRAGDAPPLVAQLMAAFTDACASIGADAPPRDGETLWEYLHRADGKVWSAHNEPLVPVFVIDQFEEVFTLGPTNLAAVTRLREDLADLAENRIPVATEQRLAADERGATRFALRSQRYRVLLSFREDFATAFERWHELPSLMRNRVQLLPMTGTHALEAVYGSASHLMDQDTAEQIVRFVASEKHADPPAAGTETVALDGLIVEPALLSLVCRGLNDSRHARARRGGPNRIDRELLASTGPGVVDRHYDTCMQDQPERVHRFVESELITESGFRKPCAQDDALREPYGVALDSLRVLVDRRLLRIEPSLGVTRVELIHDLLTPTVVARRDARRSADRQRQIDAELRKREEAQRAIEAQRRARQRMRVVVGVAAAAILIAAAVGAIAAYALRQEHIANDERAKANSQARVAQSRELASAAITRLDLDPELAVRLALEATRVSPTAQAVSALRQALFRWPGRSGGPSAIGDAAPGLRMRELKGHTDDVMGVAFSPDGTRLLSVACDRTARLWDVATGAEVFVLRDHRASLSVGAFSRDGRLIATAGGNPCLTEAYRTDPNDTEIRVWDAASGRVIAHLPGSPQLVVGAAFSADGSEIAAGGIDGEVRIWTRATGQMRVVGTQSAGIQSVEYSPDGQQLATGGFTTEAGSSRIAGGVIIWNPQTGARLTQLNHERGVLAVAYGGTAGGDILLASVDLTGIAKVWNARTFALRRELKSYSSELNGTAFSRDSRFLVTAGDDLSIWETETGARLRALTGRGSLYATSMSADGRIIAAGGAHGFVSLLNCDVCVPIDALVKLATDRSPRDFTEQERKDFLH
jgi:WD40 repeat protein